MLARATTVGVLALTALWACAGKSADEDDDDGGGGQGGASASGGGGSTAAVGATGATRPGYCMPTPTLCTQAGGPTTFGPPLGQACSTENNYCQGSYCNDSYSASSYSVMCCNGKWTSDFELVNGAYTCPGLPEPGEPFLCESGLSCIAGETYCDERSGVGAGLLSSSCPDLCPAGDCSCFCTPDSTESCSFERDDGNGTLGHCTCGWWKSSMGPEPGTGIQVNCMEVIVPDPGPCELYPNLDDECLGRGVGYMCNGPDLPQPSGCQSIGTIGTFTSYCCQ